MRWRPVEELNEVADGTTVAVAMFLLNDAFTFVGVLEPDGVRTALGVVPITRDGVFVELPPLPVHAGTENILQGS